MEQVENLQVIYTLHISQVPSSLESGGQYAKEQFNRMV